MTPALLALAALSGAASAETTVVSNTMLQIRHDFFGETLIPDW